MASFLSILKVLLPLLAQFLGAWLTAQAGINQGKADATQATVAQRATYVYGQGALGLSLLGAGIGATHVIAAKDKAKAKAELPASPEGMDSTLHCLTVTQAALIADVKSTDQDLDSMNALIKKWRTNRRAQTQ